MKPIVLVLSCEHAVNTVPPQYRDLFKKKPSILETTCAYDLGALDITQHLQQHLGCDHTQSTVSRLLIDCNRNIKHPRCFSRFTRAMTSSEQQRLIDDYYLPFRQKTSELIASHIQDQKQVLHLSVHTFKPFFRGNTRNAAIGILYNPRRHAEKEVAREWYSLLSHQDPSYRVRMNYPYSGAWFNFTSTFRQQYSESDYLGISLDINQMLLEPSSSREALLRVLASTLHELLILL